MSPYSISIPKELLLPVLVFACCAIHSAAFAASAESCGSSPLVTTTSGQVRGTTMVTQRGECYVYFGVPFAAPPIGNLRWQKPQPPECWSDVKDCTSFASACISVTNNGSDPTIESEDCLYLNIFVPKENGSSIDDDGNERANGTNPGRLPVMVYIHGGGFAFGNAQEHSGPGTCENLASRGVLVVIVQYRLLLYGFFSSGDPAALGNYGIWDQVEALQWIQSNIADFGGDPARVTIFGNSAGSASVSYLTYMPVAKDLYSQSISQSGSALAPFALPADALENYHRFVESANCSNASPLLDSKLAAMECLRNLPTIELQRVYHATFGTALLQFRTRVDGELFNSTTFRELKNGKKRAIIGVTSGESPMPYASCLSNAENVLNEALSGIFKGNSTEDEVMKEIARYAYVDSKGDRGNATFVCQQAAELSANHLIHASAAAEAASKALAGNPLWVYTFDYYNDDLFPPDYPFEKRSPHAHDLCYLFTSWVANDTPFPRTFCPTKLEGDHKKIANYMGEMWTNFAITGDPSPTGFEWPRFVNVNNANTLHIGTKFAIEPNFYKEPKSFFYGLRPNIERILGGNDTSES